MLNLLKRYVNRLKNEFHGYNLSSFSKDVMAGLTVTAVALPLALAFGRQQRSYCRSRTCNGDNGRYNHWSLIRRVIPNKRSYRRYVSNPYRHCC